MDDGTSDLCCVRERGREKVTEERADHKWRGTEQRRPKFTRRLLNSHFCIAWSVGRLVAGWLLTCFQDSCRCWCVLSEFRILEKTVLKIDENPRVYNPRMYERTYVTHTRSIQTDSNFKLAPMSGTMVVPRTSSPLHFVSFSAPCSCLMCNKKRSQRWKDPVVNKKYCRCYQVKVAIILIKFFCAVMKQKEIISLSSPSKI